MNATTFLVDTDWIIDVLHGRAAATAALIDLAPSGLAIRDVTYGELHEGAWYAPNRDRDLQALYTLLVDKTVLPVTHEIWERFAILRGSLSRAVRRQLGDMDLLIAATALHHDLILVTRNTRGLLLVPGLSLYRPSADGST